MYEGKTKYFKYKMTFFKFDGEKDKVIIFSKIEWGNGLRYSTMFDTHTAIPYFDKIISKDDKGRKVVLKFIAKEDVEFEQIQNYIKERAIENSF